MNWYYAESGNQRGPVSDEQLDGLIASGTLKADTLVWKEGMANWSPLSQVRPQTSPSTPPAPTPDNAPPVHPDTGDTPPVAGVVCSECNQVFPAENTIRYGNTSVCATCKPVFVQKLKEGRIQAGPLIQSGDFAGFWIRAGAKIIDGILIGFIIGIPILILILTTGLQDEQVLATLIGISQIIGLVGAIAYNTFLTGKWGATLGKMACGLRVVTPEGDRVTYLRAFGRAWGEQLSAMICYIGFIIAGFDDEKRALHDHICGTRVIRK